MGANGPNRAGVRASPQNVAPRLCWLTMIRLVALLFGAVLHPGVFLVLAAWFAGGCATKGAAPAAAGGGARSPGAELRIMTFNIRYAGGDKGEHAWSLRRDAVAECIAAADPDILGMQEVEAVQADWIRERFPAYAFHGVGRADGMRKGEFAPILYRADRFTLLESGHFWISETPDVPGSKSWNTACERMASWVRLRDRQTKQPLVVINTHLDHVSAEARDHGVEMIRARARQLSRMSVSSEINAVPCQVIITGDFNAPADGPLGERLCGDGDSLQDAYRAANSTPLDDEASFNGWTPQTKGKRIDWIVTSREFVSTNAMIDRREPGGVMPSDHYPVIVTLRPRTAGASDAKPNSQP